MASWGVVSTVRAPEDQVLAFVAHHLSLGAAHVWLFFDDPKDPAYARISRLPRVTATRCTDFYWALRGGRKSDVIFRQIPNARGAQKKCRLDWLAHIDVDEFLFASRPIADVLGSIPATEANLLLEPYEAMYDPDLPDDIFTARQFRGPLQGVHQALVAPIFGDFAAELAKGALAHVLGKSMVRPRVRGLQLSLHGVIRDGERVTTAFHPDLRILHFHAQDPVAWQTLLPERLTKGAYHHQEERVLNRFLSQASAADLARFHRETMTLSPEKAALLQAHDRLITTDLGLRQKVADLLAGRLA